MKQFKIIALFLVLVFFPLGSWVYLQKGLDFRKALGKELEVKGVAGDFISAPTGIDFLEGKTSLVILPDATIDRKQLGEIYNQFKQAYTFQLINGNRSFDNSEFAQEKEWSNISFTTNHSNLKDKTALIVDATMQVRNYYGGTDEELKSMVQQLAVSFPRKTARDIVEKKDIKTNE